MLTDSAAECFAEIAERRLAAGVPVDKVMREMVRAVAQWVGTPIDQTRAPYRLEEGGDPELVFRSIGVRPVTANELVLEVGLDRHTVATSLSRLCRYGLIRRVRRGCYVRR